MSIVPHTHVILFLIKTGALSNAQEKVEEFISTSAEVTLDKFQETVRYFLDCEELLMEIRNLMQTYPMPLFLVFNDYCSKYKLMEGSLFGRQKALRSKIPEIKKTLQAVEMLIAQQVSVQHACYPS